MWILVSGSKRNEGVPNTPSRPMSISHTEFLKVVFRSQPPPKSVNLSFTITSIKNKLTDVWGSWLLQNDLRNTLCEIKCVHLLANTQCSSRIKWHEIDQQGANPNTISDAMRQLERAGRRYGLGGSGWHQGCVWVRGELRLWKGNSE